MAKANSPVRLDAKLMAEAAQSGLLNHRSAAETVEYWANLGKRISRMIDPEQLLKVQAGALEIDLKETHTQPVDPEDIFTNIELRRQSGGLNKFVSRDKPVYQVCKTHPGKLEQIMPDGAINIGQFKNGRFHPDKKSSLTHA